MKRTAGIFSNYHRLEILLFSIIWLLLFITPLYYNRIFDTILWTKVFAEWYKISLYLLLFIANLYWLVPNLLFKKKTFQYILISIIFALGISFTAAKGAALIVENENQGMPKMELGPGLPPMELSSDMPPPKGFNPSSTQIGPNTSKAFFRQLFISLLVIAAGTSYRTFSRLISEENSRIELEKEQLRTELALLRHQVNPHFLMNTLNNIHALIDLDNNKAKDAVIKLSGLMRYLLYDSSHKKVALNKELEFIENYIGLMKIRYPNNVKIITELPEDCPTVEIPPLLLISFIENSFKHGISYRNESWIQLRINTNEKYLNCEISNSKHNDHKAIEKKYSGIGLSNVRKTLQLLYNDDFTLDITDEKNSYIVKLIIPINEH